MIEIKGRKGRNHAREYMISEYEVLTEKVSGKVWSPDQKEERYDYETIFEKWEDIFKFSGLGEIDELDLSLSEFEKAITVFNQKDPEPYEVVKEIEVDGRTYRAFQDGEKLSLPKWNLLMKFMKKNPKRYLAELLAIIFEDVDLTKTEHKDEAHIKHKAKLFREKVNAAVAVPYLSFVLYQMAKQKKESLEALEAAEIEEKETQNEVAE
jgi:hypothetical protein